MRLRNAHTTATGTRKLTSRKGISSATEYPCDTPTDRFHAQVISHSAANAQKPVIGALRCRRSSHSTAKPATIPMATMIKVRMQQLPPDWTRAA